MKKIVLLLSACVAWLATVPSQASADVVSGVYKVRPAVVLRAPLQGDSINMSGQKFEVSHLLRTSVSLDFDKADVSSVQADTAGYVSLPQAQKDYLVHRLYTHLRADRFTRGTLKVWSPVRFQLFVNGDEEYTKETSEDSLSLVVPAEVTLRLEPQADYDVVVKLLSSADDKMPPSLRCEFVPDKAFAGVSVSLSSDLKRRLSLYNTAFGAKVTGVSLSPDGKYLLTSYSETYSPERSFKRRELTEVKTGRVVMADVPQEAAWMPSGSRLYYTVKGRERRNLVVLNPVTLQTETVAQDIPDGRFRWSPAEDYLIYYDSDEGPAEEGFLKRILMPDDRIPGARDRMYVSRYDLASGMSERLTYGSHDVYVQDISQDGRKLLCLSNRADITRCPFTFYTLFQIDLTTLQADTLVRDDGSLNGAMYSPDGRQVLITGGPNALDSIGKNCGNHPIANDFDTQAFLMDLATRQVKPITRDFNPSVEPVQWNRADGRIYFNTTDRDCRTVYCYDPVKDEFTRLPLQQDVITSFSVAQDAPRVAAYVGGGNYNTGVAYLYDTRKQTSTLLADPMKPVLDGMELGEMQPWNFTAADGTLIEGMMCLPPQFDPQKKYPLIVYYYGGSLPTTRGITSPYCAQLFASRDYVVYVLQPSGTIGYGQEFSARHVNAWGDYTADEIVEGTRKFCEAHPFVDSSKVGCLGASYGGFMTMYLQTRTDIFAAAASHAGISNVTSYWGEGYWGYSYNAVAAARSYPWSHPELFTRHGALFNADKINTPLLLLHGTVDTNVPIGESIQLYNALKILGKPVEFITVGGENHFVSDYDKRVKWHNSIMAWFAKWLQDSPQWWDDLYPERHW